MPNEVIEPKQDALAVATPMELLRLAIEANADVEKLRALMEMTMEWRKFEAEQAFVEAMNAFKAEPPIVEKNKHVKITPKDPTKYGAEYDHATLDHVCDVVTKALSKHGISHRWKVEQDKDWIKVTCVLTHQKGHSVETTLLGAPDLSGSKNPIQAVGSTVTYLERYTLLAATGLAAKGQDDDGRMGGGMAEERLVEHLDWIANAGDRVELEKLYKQAAREALDSADKHAIEQLKAAKAARLKELS